MALALTTSGIDANHYTTTTQPLPDLISYLVPTASVSLYDYYTTTSVSLHDHFRYRCEISVGVSHF